MSESDNMPLPVTAIQDESSELEAEQQRVLRDYRAEIQNAQKEADNAYETITAAHEEKARAEMRRPLIIEKRETTCLWQYYINRVSRRS